MNKDIATLAKLIGDFSEALNATGMALNAFNLRIENLESKLAKLESDMTEVLDVTGIAHNRWKAARVQECQEFVQQRIAYYRDAGEGLMQAKKLAYIDLRERHDREKQAERATMVQPV